MRIVSGVVSGVTRLSRINAQLSRDARRRVAWFDYYETRGRNARLTCRHFGISPQTFYRWKGRYNPEYLKSLEDRSHRPKRVRYPTWTADQVDAVLKTREKYPRWGKDKLAVLLKEQGYPLSSSMVGRILCHLKKRGVLREALPNHVSAKKRQRQRPYTTRKPKDYKAMQMGDIVQLDTLDLRPLPSVVLKHFTAHDVISRWNGHRYPSECHRHDRVRVS